MNKTWTNATVCMACLALLTADGSGWQSLESIACWIGVVLCMMCGAMHNLTKDL